MTFTTATVTWIMQYKNSNIHTQAYCLHRILTNIPQIHHVCVLCSYWSKSPKNIMSEQDSEWVNNKQLNSIGRPHINIRIVLCFLEYLENGCAITWIHLLIIFWGYWIVNNSTNHDKCCIYFQCFSFWPEFVFCFKNPPILLFSDSVSIFETQWDLVNNLN